MPVDTDFFSVWSARPGIEPEPTVSVFFSNVHNLVF